jgi:hypothetical protein
MPVMLGVGGLLTGIGIIGGAVYYGALTENQQKNINKGVNIAGVAIKEGVHMVDGVLTYVGIGAVLTPFANASINPIMKLLKTKKDVYYNISPDGGIDYYYYLGKPPAIGQLQTLKDLAAKINDPTKKKQVLDSLTELENDLIQQQAHPDQRPRLGPAGVAFTLLRNTDDPANTPDTSILSVLEAEITDPADKKQLDDLRENIARNIDSSVRQFHLLTLMNTDKNPALQAYIKDHADSTLGATTEQLIPEECNILDFLNNDPHGQSVEALDMPYSSLVINRGADNKVESFSIRINKPMLRSASTELELLHEVQVLGEALLCMPNIKSLTITIPTISPPTPNDPEAEKRMAVTTYKGLIAAGWPPEKLNFKFDSYNKAAEKDKDGKPIPGSDINCNGKDLFEYTGQSNIPKDSGIKAMPGGAPQDKASTAIKTKHEKNMLEAGRKQEQERQNFKAAPPPFSPSP